ncbi:hypothetical protein JOB18_021295 [Solea senegalensis]|uniref:Uncharacterized protein n=1 Tax=Solea senegalensis TaxID=28829 RepID=A0AAV6PC93_SOLSE|nr:hypothetical protein JOB18_021295 [Solea senegalensis]
MYAILAADCVLTFFICNGSAKTDTDVTGTRDLFDRMRHELEINDKGHAASIQQGHLILVSRRSHD